MSDCPPQISPLATKQFIHLAQSITGFLSAVKNEKSDGISPNNIERINYMENKGVNTIGFQKALNLTEKITLMQLTQNLS